MTITQTTLGALAPGDVLSDSSGTPLMVVTLVERGAKFKDYVIVSGSHPSGVGTAKSIGGPATKVCYIAQLPTPYATATPKRHWLQALIVVCGVVIGVLVLLLKGPTHKRKRASR